MSHPSAARQDDTVPAEPKFLVCPRCKKQWPADGGPTTCPTDGLALVQPVDLTEDDPMIGRTLEGRYTILAKLGAGSMGTVYRAKQHAMGREVAIKILRGDRAVDESAKARFMREARANSLLASPNTVTVFDFGQSESGEFYLAMELLEGESLGQRIARVGRLPAPQAVDACRQALRSLGEAHAKGIIHRDLKPDNLFFARVMTSHVAGASEQGHDEIVKVLDFGIAKMIDPDSASPMSVVETQAGTVFGTPRYMSPEQAQGKPLDARSDLYSLAVILYQMLAGRPPFTDNDAVVVMARHIKSMPKRPNEAVPEAMISSELEDVVMRTLAKDPKDRPGSAEVFAGELLAALESHGAQISGVRPSVTNAAGIRVPESMRPPPMLLPKRKPARAFPLVLLAVPIVLVGAAIGVYFGLARRAPAATASAPALVAEPSASSLGSSSGTGSAASAATNATNGGELDDQPTFTPDSLPRAASTSGSTSSPSGNRGLRNGRPGVTGHPSGKGSSSHAPAAASGSAGSGYGIFE